MKLSFFTSQISLTISSFRWFKLTLHGPGSFLVNQVKEDNKHILFSNHGHLFRRKACDQHNPIRMNLTTLAWNVRIVVVIHRHKVQNSHSLKMKIIHGTFILIIAMKTRKRRARVLWEPHLITDLPAFSLR